MIGPKPDNRCSAWAVLFPCLRVPGGPALGVTRSPWLGQGAVTRFEDGGGLSYLTGANGRTDLALQRQWAREWRRGAHEGREGGQRGLAPGSRECFGCDESSGTSSVCVARHGGDATIWLLVAFPGNPGRTRGGASWVGIRERKVPRGLRDTDWSIETESQSQKRSTQDKERRERPWETTCGLRGG